ncbi:MAG: SurA N-terminal domain-containing protein [Bacteroidota bacterium]
MSVLEKIRSKTGLLVSIIGLALIIFVLESLLGSGSALFTSNDTLVGKIAGDKIDYTTFNNKVNEITFQWQQNNQGAAIDDQTKEQIVQSVWGQMINERTVKAEFKKLGLIIPSEELFDLMLVNPHETILQQFTDPQTKQINENFRKPDGSFDVAKLRQLVAGMPVDQEKTWKQLEKQVEDVRTAEKYNALIKKAIYVTTAEAKDAYIAQNKKKNVSFVLKRYSAISDSAVKITDDEINAYHNAHKNEYLIKEPVRKIEYVAYDVTPSKKDYEDLQNDAKRVAEQFKTIGLKEDSSYIAQESDNAQVNISNYRKENMIITDSSVFKSPKGTVFGPYTEGTFIKIYKLSNIKSIADSAKVRHILIGFKNAKTQKDRSPAIAKRIADSILVLLKAKVANFDTLVKNISDDLGSVEKGGDYGWFDENKGFVDPFKNAGLEGVVGNISIVPTQFGFHIIEVLNVSKGRHNSYTVAQISKMITPSVETTQEYYKKATDFAGKNKTTEDFNKAVEAEKLNKRILENIKESDKQFPGGLDDAKSLVQWIYKAKKGDVSDAIEFKDRFIVANLVSVKDKGIAPLEEVLDEVKPKAIRDKKAELFISEFKTKVGNSSSIENIGLKMGLNVEKAEGLDFVAYNVSNIGREDALVGTASALKFNAISKPIKGDNGVFILKVDKEEEIQLPKEFKAKQKELEQTNAYQVESEVYEALKEKANIDDHRGKFGF